MNTLMILLSYSFQTAVAFGIFFLDNTPNKVFFGFLYLFLMLQREMYLMYETRLKRLVEENYYKKAYESKRYQLWLHLKARYKLNETANIYVIGIILALKMLTSIVLPAVGGYLLYVIVV